MNINLLVAKTNYNCSLYGEQAHIFYIEGYLADNLVTYITYFYSPSLAKALNGRLMMEVEGGYPSCQLGY